MSYRMVRTEQIGPSGHKNEYHIGVLHGNWQEERFTLGRKAQGKLHFEGESEARAQFIPRAENGSVIAKPERMFPTECPRELLFGQGPAATTISSADQQQNWLTTSQLRELQQFCGNSSSSASASSGLSPRSHKNQNGGTALTPMQLAKLVELNASKSAAKAEAALTKPQQVDDQDGDDNPFKTTKQATYDTTASRILSGQIPIPPRGEGVRARGGNITNELTTAGCKMNLRK
jgi:hypothetical protein